MTIFKFKKNNKNVCFEKNKNTLKLGCNSITYIKQNGKCFILSGNIKDANGNKLFNIIEKINNINSFNENVLMKKFF